MARSKCLINSKSLVVRERGSSTLDIRETNAYRKANGLPLNRCDRCPFTSLRPNGNWVSMERHHICGNHRCINRAHIELLCPNCHGEDPSSRKIKGSSFIRPMYHELAALVRKYTAPEIARKLNGSSGAVYYWIAQMDLADAYYGCGGE